MLFVERLQFRWPFEAEDQPRQVALRVGVGHDHAMPALRNLPREVEGRRRLANAALVVEQCDPLCHGTPLAAEDTMGLTPVLARSTPPAPMEKRRALLRSKCRSGALSK